MKLKQFFVEYFSMNRMQLSGTMVLIFLIIVVSLLPRFVANYKANRSQPDFARFDSILANYVPLADESVSRHSDTEISDTVFMFDPNTATYDDFLCLGLSERISANIVKYRNSGGRFKVPADFAKIYGISDSVYSRLEPYISIAAKSPAESRKQTAKNRYSDGKKAGKAPKTDYEPKELPIVELNAADSAQLVALRGIGSVLARRIIAYREMLGGYHSVEQLREIRNLSPETYANLYSQFTVDTVRIMKIDLNNFKYKQLSSHPYMSVAQLNAIMNYKKLMGKFNAVDDLLKYKLVDTLTYDKISPYLEAR
ncbi:MAG: helix-hairpin-helix domain-containing protein [Salinivirgaceae bacterium]|nr:helix-hairpin-helix domain-containing protein [Salinivirgaceae bacterium]